MDATRIMELFADQQGWTDETCLGLCLEYIERQQDNPTFRDYLAGVIAADSDAAKALEEI